jgi:guanylate kinase
MSAEAPLLIVLSAPSGAGKTTLCHELLAARSHVHRAITCTTRSPRPGERNGQDYHFLDQKMFEERRARGEFLEWAVVHGNNYGTLKSEVVGILRGGNDALLNVDVQGAASIRQLSDPELSRALVSVFLTPASIEVLEARLRKRGTDSIETIERRLKEARKEIARWREFDFVIVSGTVKEDLERMLVILDAECMRTTRLTNPEFETHAQ